MYIYDPYFTEMNNVESLDELLEKSFAIIIATNHKQFLSINAEILKKYKVEIVIDGKNCLNKEEIKSSGIYYKGIGR